MSSQQADAGAPPQATPEDPWLALARAQTAAELCRAWLPIMCGMVGSARAGLLLLEDAAGSYSPLAVWPDDRDFSYLGDVAQEALVKRQGVVRRAHPEEVQFAYPLASGEHLFGVVVLELAAADEQILTASMRLLHWGAGWLIDLYNRRKLGEQEGRLERSAFLFDLLIAVLGEDEPHKANLALVNSLAQRFGCRRVQMGVEKGSTLRVAAMSHSAWFDDKANLVDLAAQAMNEAFDQRACVVLPEPEEGGSRITAALRRYAQESGSANLCAVPVESANRVVAAWLLERDSPFTPEDLEALETLALAVGPVLALQQSSDESLLAHARRSWAGTLRQITDSSRPGLKLLALIAVFGLAIMAVYPAQFRVSAQAAVEGEVQRVAAAPFEGYIKEAFVRAGDLVKEGELLALLDDKDLRLEQVRWEAELEVATRKEREALAVRDRVELRLASAQANQARAQLDLVLEKLNRVRVNAPFDGVVTRGDLSQQLGSPVQLGEVLFELAPLDAWRVILKVDERDIAWVTNGQAGQPQAREPARSGFSAGDQAGHAGLGGGRRPQFLPCRGGAARGRRQHATRYGRGEQGRRRQAQPAVDLDASVHRLAAAQGVGVVAVSVSIGP
jgi:hypothetical protein